MSQPCGRDEMIDRRQQVAFIDVADMGLRENDEGRPVLTMFLKRLTTTVALVAAALMPITGSAGDAADEAAILEIWSTYSAARVAGDADTWLSLWDKEGVRMAPGAPAAPYAKFSQGIPAAFAKSQPPSMEIAAEEVVIMGDWAFSSGNFTVGEKVDGKFLTIFRRQDDGTWRIYRDAFNMNTP